MSVPDAAVSLLLDNLSNILKNNHHMVADVSESVVALRRELGSLKVLLNDCAKYNYDNDSLGELKEIRSILYEAEDAVDVFVVHSAVRKSRRWISKAFQQLGCFPTVLNVRKMIEDVGDKVRLINRDVDALQYFRLINRDVDALQYPPDLNEPERRIIEVTQRKEGPIWLFLILQLYIFGLAAVYLIKTRVLWKRKE